MSSKTEKTEKRSTSNRAFKEVTKVTAFCFWSTEKRGDRDFHQCVAVVSVRVAINDGILCSVQCVWPPPPRSPSPPPPPSRTSRRQSPSCWRQTLPACLSPLLLEMAAFLNCLPLCNGANWTGSSSSWVSADDCVLIHWHTASATINDDDCRCRWWWWWWHTVTMVVVVVVPMMMMMMVMVDGKQNRRKTEKRRDKSKWRRRRSSAQPLDEKTH